MKVALVIERHDATGGGAERWTDRHARELLRRGHRVSLVARSFQGVPEGAKTLAVEFPRTRTPRLAFAETADRLVKAEGFDVVHDMGAGWSGDLFMPHHGTRAGGFLQNERMLPAWLRPIRRRFAERAPRYREFRELETRQFANEASTFVALSNLVRRHAMEHYRIDPRRVRIVPNGIDPERFRPASADQRRELRARFGFRDDSVVFLFAAHNFRLKGLGYILPALAELTRQGIDARLMVLGGDSPTLWRWRAWRLGIGRRVRFAGDQADPLPWFQAADTFLQPTWYDPCSLVTLEAFACGLPVITTSFNGAGELMMSGREGFVIDAPDHHSELTRTMELLARPEPRASASLAARTLALANTQDRNTERLLDLYTRVADRPRAAAA
jgi:UDP-glucose:(heptosyl)LPS alpha-1,3-glucosyltransferase